MCCLSLLLSTRYNEVREVGCRGWGAARCRRGGGGCDTAAALPGHHWMECMHAVGSWRGDHAVELQCACAGQRDRGRPASASAQHRSRAAPAHCIHQLPIPLASCRRRDRSDAVSCCACAPCAHVPCRRPRHSRLTVTPCLFAHRPAPLPPCTAPSPAWRQVISPDQMFKGFRSAIDALEDLRLDVPDVVDLLALFICRWV